jgi:integrase
MDEITKQHHVIERQASTSVFEEYWLRRPASTLKAQRGDLLRFLSYLRGHDIDPPLTTPQGWGEITWAMVEGFKVWQLKQGFAISSINRSISTVRTYARLAYQGGHMSAEQKDRIMMVQGYRQRDGKEIDKRRSVSRIGSKKDSPTQLARDQAHALKSQPDTPHGRRDRLLVYLLLDLGLRVSEVCDLQTNNIDLSRGTITFYRRKTDTTETHNLLTRGLVAAARAYLEHDARKGEPLMRRLHGSGSLGESGVTPQAIRRRLKALGEQIGLPHLSPHDCRHYWATQMARNNTPIDRMKQAGGWKSPSMPLRYIAEETIANEGVNLGQETATD